MSSTDLPPITLLLQEIQAVTSAMRRNQRWASATSLSTPSSQPLPPYLQASRLARRSRASSQSNFTKKRGSSEGVEEGDLMDGFVELRRLLTGTNDVTTLDPLSLVQPFLALIRSSLTSGVITSLSLLSLHSIILNILPAFLTPLPTSIAPSTPLQIALAHTTATLSQCRFPSSSPQQDELVLLRLLRVIESLSLHFPLPNSSGTSSMLDQMGDESVCELLEVGLGMLARARLGEGLRNTAQSCVQTLVRGCFTRLRRMSPEDMQRLMQAGTVVTVETKIGPKVKEQSPVVDASEGSGLDEKTIEGDLKSSKPIEPSRPPFSPHGLPTILELLRVLIALLNPSDQAHTDSMRLSALAILNTALEVGGTSLGRWPELREGVRDEGCRYLFQLTRSDSPALLTQSLRTTSTLFSTMLPHLKLQLELFLSYLIDRLTPPTPPPFPQIMTQSHSRPVSPVSGAVDGTPDPQRSKQAGTPSIDMHTPGHSTPKPISLLPPVPGETKELMLETLSQIALRPSFMVDCWTNFDCSTESENIFERLISFLTRGVYPSGPPKADGSTHIFEGLENTQLLSLEILLTYVASMASRLEHGGESWPSQAPPAQLLDERKSRKGVLLTGAAMFNAKPKNGLAYLEKNGIIVPEPGEGNVEERRLRAIAQFLRHSTRLDKKLSGEYISRPDQLDLLKAFIGLFDFKGKSIADAMRELLETFRLPGESQPISRITETFAEHFISFNPPEIASQDAVYVLAYSVIMLNTDLHNPQNRKRMTIDDYKRNLRGVNDGKDFDPEYLAAIHESIKKREIILPEEHVGQPGFDYAWKGLMQRSRTAGPMIVCNTSVFDEAMFRASWRPLISAIAYAFTLSAQDEHVIQRAITGFRQCASLAGHFHLPEVFDTIVQSLAPATGLLEDSNDDYQMTNYPVVDKDNTSLTVSPLSVRFGQSYRSQLATVVLFTIANGNGNAIRQGWGQIFEMFQTLFIHSLLPPPMLQMEDFLAGTSMIPMKTAAPAPVPERRPEGGLLSTLSSYLLSPYGASEDRLVVETSDEDVENTLVAVDCLSSCKLEELYAEILHLEVDALIPALKALRSLAEARTTGKLAARNELRAENSPGLRHEGQLPYDPTCVFHLEMMVSLASRGKPHIAETWPITFEYISSLLSSAQSYSVLLIERAVVGLLRLCLVVSETADLRDQLYIALDVLRSLPSTVLNAVSEQLMAGIAKILEKDSSVVKSHTEWGLIIALFRATVAHPEASKVTLAIVQKMAAGGDSYPGLSQDNYAGVVALLDEFATAAGAAGVGRGRRASQSATLGPTVERGLSALDSLYGLRNVIPDLMESSGLSGQDGWNTFWLPPLLAISKQCVNIHHSIRQRAIAHLQRLLTSPQLLSTEQALATIFDRVLFPIMDELLKPQVYERDPSGMGETRLRAATLLCKVFLQYVVRLAEGNLISGMFVRVLDRLERFMKGEKEMLNEATESLKNVILVMYSSDLLLPPPSSSDIADTRTKEQREIWTSGAERIERVLPGFLAEAMRPTEPQRSSPVKSGTTVA